MSVAGDEMDKLVTEQRLCQSLTFGAKRAAQAAGRDLNQATGIASSVSAGLENTASGPLSSVSGGSQNTAAGNSSTVSGGVQHTAQDTFDWVAGGLFEDF